MVRCSDQDVILSGLVQLPNVVIEGAGFSRCRILGPAVASILGNDNIFARPRFDVADPREMLFLVKQGESKVGVIGLENCSFEDCVFIGIGFAVTRASLSVFGVPAEDLHG